jgi:hypothetical protein
MERLGDHIVITLVPWRGAAVIVDDLSAVGAADAGHVTGALGEERRLAPGRVPRGLRCRKRDKHGVEALGDGVTVRVEGVWVVNSGYSDGGVDGVKDASPRGPGRVVAREIKEVCVKRGVHVQLAMDSFFFSIRAGFFVHWISVFPFLISIEFRFFFRIRAGVFISNSDSDSLCSYPTPILIPYEALTKQ